MRHLRALRRVRGHRSCHVATIYTRNFCLFRRLDITRLTAQLHAFLTTDVRQMRCPLCPPIADFPFKNPAPLDFLTYTLTIHNTPLQSIFAFASAGCTVLRSGSDAATSSIFLNCQGNLEGYRNGRRSKPERHRQQNAERYSQYDTNDYHQGCIVPATSREKQDSDIWERSPYGMI